jgi:hypothetical protein
LASYSMTSGSAGRKYASSNPALAPDARAASRELVNE